LVIREDEKIIPIVYYDVGKTGQFILNFRSTDEQNTGFYFAEANTNNDYYTLIKKAKSYALHELETPVTRCVYKNGTYAMQVGYGQGNVYIFNSNYDLINTININPPWWGRIYDLTSDGSRFLNGYDTTWYEYNTNTSTNTIISSTAIPVDAKYSPLDETVIFYISGQEIHSIKNDGTNDQLILTGYNISHLTFNPAGDKIIFSTYDKVYSVNLNGTGANELTSYTLPYTSGNYLFALFYNKIVYVDYIFSNKINVINF
jgi:hypothetical protein